MSGVIDARAIGAVVSHLNGDHAADNLVIVRGHGWPEAMSARFVGFDALEARFSIITSDAVVLEVAIPWLHPPVVERTDVRREVVAMFVAAGGQRDSEPLSDSVPGGSRGGASEALQ